MKQIYTDSLAMFKLGKALCARYNKEKSMYRICMFLGIQLKLTITEDNNK